MMNQAVRVSFLLLRLVLDTRRVVMCRPADRPTVDCNCATMRRSPLIKTLLRSAFSFFLSLMVYYFSSSPRLQFVFPLYNNTFPLSSSFLQVRSITPHTHTGNSRVLQRSVLTSHIPSHRNDRPRSLAHCTLRVHSYIVTLI